MLKFTQILTPRLLESRFGPDNPDVRLDTTDNKTLRVAYSGSDPYQSLMQIKLRDLFADGDADYDETFSEEEVTITVELSCERLVATDKVTCSFSLLLTDTPGEDGDAIGFRLNADGGADGQPYCNPIKGTPGYDTLGDVVVLDNDHEGRTVQDHRLYTLQFKPFEPWGSAYIPGDSGNLITTNFAGMDLSPNANEGLYLVFYSDHEADADEFAFNYLKISVYAGS